MKFCCNFTVGTASAVAFVVALTVVTLGKTEHPAIINAVSISIIFIISYAVYVPELLYVKIVYEPSVAELGEPVVVPE